MTIQQSRGYSFESHIVKRFNAIPNWKALRLGSPSVALPDVLAVNDEEKSMVIIEAKSRQSSSADIPPDQLQRCLGFAKLFGLYYHSIVVAFKFINKETKFDSRTKREYYYDATEIVSYYDNTPIDESLPTIRCHRDGSTFVVENGHRKPITFLQYTFPC